MSLYLQNNPCLLVHLQPLTAEVPRCDPPQQHTNFSQHVRLPTEQEKALFGVLPSLWHLQLPVFKKTQRQTPFYP